MNKDIHILFGLRIKELRVRAHISQEELSKLADGLKVEVKELFNFSK